MNNPVSDIGRIAMSGAHSGGSGERPIMNEVALSEFLIGESSPMRRLRAQITKIAKTNLPVLIQGESGTGKELVAQALHLTSSRSGAFVAFNVCAIPEALFESALFGHVRGAFTGATADSAGYLAEADRGTVFLDEIGSLSSGSQAKLLRAIETRSFRPVGGRQDRSSSFRVIAATNVSIDVLLSGAPFRNDLAYRLCGDVIAVPPLRDHSDDIPQLVRHFVNQVVPGPSYVSVSADGIDVLRAHAWPGNVRQLRHVVQRLVAYADDGGIDAPLVQRVLQSSPDHSEGLDDRQGFAKRRLVQVLQEHGWRDQRAAAALGVHPTTIFRWRKTLGIQRPAISGPRALRDQSAPVPASDSNTSAHCSNSAMDCSNKPDRNAIHTESTNS